MRKWQGAVSLVLLSLSGLFSHYCLAAQNSGVSSTGMHRAREQEPLSTAEGDLNLRRLVVLQRKMHYQKGVIIFQSNF